MLQSSTEATFRNHQELPSDARDKSSGTTLSAFPEQFYRLVNSYRLFNLFFWGLISLQVSLFYFFFTSLADSSLLSLCLAGIVLTTFTYLFLRVYFRGRLPEELRTLIDQTVEHSLPGEHKPSLARAHFYFEMEASILGMEYRFFRAPKFLQSMEPWMEKLSCLLHWEHVFLTREQLVILAIDENIEIVKRTPTSLESHANLAEAYVTLSCLYAQPSKQSLADEHWLPAKAYSDEIKLKFRSTAKRAIEEFKIIQEYAPNDPWVHVQLAYSYQDLQMPKEEIREYETILKLVPEDPDTIQKLGLLYFHNGQEAKGLKMYELLLELSPDKAPALIEQYGSNSTYL